MDLMNQFLRGNINYPKNQTKAYHLLVNYQKHWEYEEATVPRNNRSTHERIMCFGCNTKGHYSKACQVSLAYVISRDPFWVEMLGCCPTTFSTTPVHWNEWIFGHLHLL